MTDQEIYPIHGTPYRLVREGRHRWAVVYANGHGLHPRKRWKDPLQAATAVNDFCRALTADEADALYHAAEMRTAVFLSPEIVAKANSLFGTADAEEPHP